MCRKVQQNTYIRKKYELQRREKKGSLLQTVSESLRVLRASCGVPVIAAGSEPKSLAVRCQFEDSQRLESSGGGSLNSAPRAESKPDLSLGFCTDKS